MVILPSQVTKEARDLAIEPAKWMMSSRIRFRHCSRLQAMLMPRHILPGMELTGADLFTLLSLKTPAYKETSCRFQGLELNDLQGSFQP